MPTNVNLPTWTTGEAAFMGGGAQAAVLIPTDIDTVIIDLSDATQADVIDIEVSQNVREDIIGINERPLRYNDVVAVNDLGGSGELRINAGSVLDFTADGWAVGDTFEIISHRSPTFGPEGTHPTTIADKQIYTVSSVAAKVIGFSEDPTYSLAEGSIVVAQSRAAVVEDSLTYSVQVGLDASSTEASVTVSEAAGRKIRLNQTTGSGVVTFEFRGLLQSGQRPPPFVSNVESRPFSGPPVGAQGVELVADAAPVWAEDVVQAGDGNTRHATATVAGTDFDVIGVKQHDKINFSGHSVTGNTGGFSVLKVIGDKLRMYEPLKGVAGTDDPRVRLGHYITAVNPAYVLGDYTEFMLQLLGAGDSFYQMQDVGIASFGPFLDSGQAARTDMNLNATPHNDTQEGPFGTAIAYGGEPVESDGQLPWGAPSTGYSVGGWFKPTTAADEVLITKSQDPQGTTSEEFSLRITSGGNIEVATRADSLPDGGAWVTSTAYAQGDRRRAVADDGLVQEVEVAGTSSAVFAGSQKVDIGSDNALADATGLANDATVYDATVNPDGAGVQNMAITGSLAQTFTLLLAELNTDTTGAVWSLEDGDLVCISSTTGEASSILIADGGGGGTDLLVTLDAGFAIESAIAGDGEPTFASVGNTVVDGVLSAGFHDGDFGALLLGATATGLANDSTVYHLEVVVDGAAAVLASVTGDQAQTYATLITELDADVTGASWSLKNGELRCTSATTGVNSDITITDGGGGGTDMLTTLSDFVSLNTAVVGLATTTWRHVSSESAFHTVLLSAPYSGLDSWDFIVVVRDAVGSFLLYLNGFEVDRLDVQTADTTPGSFGTPTRHAFTVGYNPGASLDVGIGMIDGSEDWTGDAAYVFMGEGTILSAAEILALYDTAQDLVLN